MKSIIWGIVLVALGVILGGRATGLFDFDVFFDGWWTLFIIIPCLVGFITEKGARTGSFIGLCIGVLLLMMCQDVIDFSMFWKLLVPGIIVILGLSLIFKNIFAKNFNAEFAKLHRISDEDEISAVFSGQNVDAKGEKFTGKKISAVFGGLKLDLRDAIIEDDVVIDASAIFGGIEILVPDNVLVKTKSSSLFGGVKNTKGNCGKKCKKNKNEEDDEKEGKSSKKKSSVHTIYVKGSAMFGGIEVK